MHIPKWLIAAAALLFVVLIASVAFFLGRETSQPAQPIAVPTQAEESPSVNDPTPESAPKLPVTDATPGAMATPTSATAPTGASSIPSTPSSSPATPAVIIDTSQVSAEARARVSDYFKQMDALQSGGSAGDPEAFATTLMQGATSGDFSGLDDLVRSAGDAERRAAALQPPAECAEYHRMAMTLLRDSSAMMTALRDGLKRNDADALSSLGGSAQSMKSRADTLAAAEKALRARFGL